MKKICSGISLVIVLFSVALAARAQNAAPPDSDFQVWTEDTIQIPVVKEKHSDGKSVDRLSLLILGTLRLGQNRLYPTDARIGAGFDLRLNGNFSFSPTYIYNRGEAVRGRKEFEHRVRFDLTYSKRFSRFSIKDRNRVEYRIRNSKSDSARYRNKFTFSVPVTREGKELFTPFAANEVFYDFREEKISRNEFSTGISRKLSKSVSAEFYYLLRNNFSGQIRTVHALGANFKIRID